MYAGKVFETSGFDKLFQKRREDNGRFVCSCLCKPRLKTSRILTKQSSVEGLEALSKIPLHVGTALLVNKLCSVCSDKACYRKQNAI